MRKLVLIGGISRSGTNLVRRIIGSHSKIAIPPGEFDFFSKYMNKKTVKEILANQRLEKWNIDFSDFYNLNHPEAFIRTLERYTESVGKEIPGEKTPFNEFYYDKVKEWLSTFELKFIHLVRNPFDVMASYKHFQSITNKQNYNLNKLSRHIINWQRSVSMGLARTYVNPEEYFLLKYEDIASDPENKTKELCDFMGVDFEKERLLNFSDYKGHKDNTSFPQIEDKKNQGYNLIRKPESRKHYLNQPEIHRISTVCGELAKAMGYTDRDYQSFPPETKSLSVSKKLRRLIRVHILSKFI